MTVLYLIARIVACCIPAGCYGMVCFSAAASLSLKLSACDLPFWPRLPMYHGISEDWQPLVR